MIGAGRWECWFGAAEQWVVGWLPIDDRDPATHVIEVETKREAQAVAAMLDRLDAKPRPEEPSR